MGSKNPFVLNDETGVYTARRAVTANEILFQAKLIRREQFKPGTQVGCPDEVSEYLRENIGDFEREVFCVLFLDTRHRIIEFEKLFYGTIDGATVYPRVVVQRALEHNAGAIICAHNHPSGVCEPSIADQAITKRIKDALALVDIRMLDHFVVSGVESTSMSERGMI